MIKEHIQKDLRNPFLGEIETEVLGVRCRKARINPGDQINLERDSNTVDGRCAVRVENAQFDPVGYLPRKMASWLTPLIDAGQIYLEGYVPTALHASKGHAATYRVNLTVFQGEKGVHLLEKADPADKLESLHQTVLLAYQIAQTRRSPESILGFVKGLKPLEEQNLLPETRLLLLLLLQLAENVRELPIE
jgi:hypothetical protein